MTSRPSYEHCVDRAAQSGLERAQAERAVHATTQALGAFVADRERVTDLVPPWLARRLGQSGEPPPAREAEPVRSSFFSLVQREEGVPLGQAVEHAELVLAALAEDLDPESVAALARRLPPELADLLQPRRLEGAASPSRRSRRDRNTLAGGRPGSRHPLSEARSERAQRHSIARADEPHADRKLSAGHGSEEEPEHTLAGGRPGADRPLPEGS